MSALIPTTAQRAVLDEEELGALILAPAGCGKTEALALRVEGLLSRKQSELPQKILVVTFSNKARDNVRDRIVGRIGANRTRSLVTIQNLHGLAGRIYIAHSYLLGLNPLATLPDDKWLPAKMKSKAGSAADRRAATQTLRDVKQLALTDEEVLAELDRRGARMAAQVERERQADNRLTYDDLPRLAEVILQDQTIAEIYRAHFSAVIVDEFQDLTPQQLRIIQAIGSGRTTYAGDLAQGIYSFTGADPKAVLAAIRAESIREIVFNESHRSSPQVLAAVNSLRRWTGGEELICATPDAWPGGGAIAVQGFTTLENEAAWVLGVAEQIKSRFPSHRIGIIGRLTDRTSTIEAAADKLGIPIHRWKDPLYNLRVARQLRLTLGKLSAPDFAKAPDKIAYLWSLTEPLEDQDLETHSELQSSYEWASDLLVSGLDAASVTKKVKAGDADALLALPGVHVLNAHTGKGQQFDWVFAVGLEQGTLPFELAKTTDQLEEELRVFSVMLSRARYGVIATYSLRVLKWGDPIAATKSKFLAPIEKVAGLLDGKGFVSALDAGTFG
jgi:DNA helicase-2/ATP-dependent DNA helicase PcrA